MRELRVLLVDDHAMMRAGFRTILSLEPDIAVVGEAATGAEAVSAAERLRPDVICMDVQMPDMDGLEATRLLTADPDSDAAILIVTTFDRDDYLFAALSAGASGFLLKNAGPEELVSAVRIVGAGDALLAPEVTRRVIERFAAGDASAAASPAPAGPSPLPLPLLEPLTEREAEVLRRMAEALSNAEIAARLFIGEATVKTHVSNVLQKLGARDRVQAVVLAHRHGLT
ncbi:DNA-binding response regulator, NarL/FixJ family, contains REC and HTH domains [Microbacterium sp. ru370.1]|uniref:response regulator n=1 Tax=unclassified Microbacterium TaxID=2609290 RepID=UPI00088B4393|nr:MULTISPECIES: response regulator transcription factor [unclassified Microbacterium]SDO30669.1 DNA-binding response regulator, NarL/FixJ family, contains REC and HTH domains [Microbacterium sp. ru370.1]SIT76094.1 DNA-binding response regulator, NarL/FixJ family, contains REC and HTH domains [Microbacterium sp. RU1D]